MNRSRFRALAALALVGALAGCEDYLSGPELTTDPNRPSEATRDQLFTGMQVRQFMMHEGSLARIGSMFTQQMAGTDRQYITLDAYGITEADFTQQFTWLYTGGGLVDMNRVQADAEAAGDRVYLGISQVWEAFTFGMAASVWGAIPYSEAAGDITTPKLDPQAQVYAQVQALLDQAIANLASGAGRNPGALDMIYGGDAQKWIQAANTLKARFYLHWVEAQAAGSADAATACGGNCVQKARDAARNGIASPANNFRTFHTAKTGEENIWFQFFRDRDSYTRTGAFFVNLLKSRNDPRLAALVAPNASGAFVGSAPATGSTGASSPSAARLDPAFRQPLITWAENQLILAETELRLGNPAAALGHVNAVRTNEGLPALSSLGANPMATIIEEKYIILFQNLEAWNDYKRTCLPAITTVGGKPVPGRLFYGEGERNVNPNVPAPSAQPTRNANDPNACS